MNTHSFVPIAEAAFIADLSAREMNRVVDEHILPDVLVDVNQSRRVAPLGAAFARFYFNTERQLAAEFRRFVLQSLASRVAPRGDRESVFSLARLPEDMNWSVEEANVRIDLSSFVLHVFQRTIKVGQANAMIRENPEVMGGAAVFAGTRVPIDIVLASIDKGVNRKRLDASYPFLTDEHIEAARTYAAVHRRPGRPRRLAEANPQLRPQGRRQVRPAA